VLAQKTVFTPNFEDGREQIHASGLEMITKEIASWPSKAEMKYEGDDRIATVEIHRRFLGAPRTEGNETVNWQQRSLPSSASGLTIATPSKVGRCSCSTRTRRRRKSERRKARHQPFGRQTRSRLQ
jgi:hypothetical protein